jgi:hypothetical protein
MALTGATYLLTAALAGAAGAQQATSPPNDKPFEEKWWPTEFAEATAVRTCWIGPLAPSGATGKHRPGDNKQPRPKGRGIEEVSQSLPLVSRTSVSLARATSAASGGECDPQGFSANSTS